MYDFTKLEIGTKLINKQRVTVEFNSAGTDWEEHEA